MRVVTLHEVRFRSDRVKNTLLLVTLQGTGGLIYYSYLFLEIAQLDSLEANVRRIEKYFFFLVLILLF